MTAGTPDRVPASAVEAALRFVREEAGFAQLTTLDREGYPVTRTMTAFLEPDWSVTLVQRRTHQRLAQWQRNPRTLVTWVGSPAPGATNEHPHVFDLGLLPPRTVSIRADAVPLDAGETVRCYLEHLAQQRGRGHTRAPERTPEQAAAELAGVRLRPRRIRLEGFGEGAAAYSWTVRRSAATDHEGGQ